MSVVGHKQTGDVVVGSYPLCAKSNIEDIVALLGQLGMPCKPVVSESRVVRAKERTHLSPLSGWIIRVLSGVVYVRVGSSPMREYKVESGCWIYIPENLSSLVEAVGSSELLVAEVRS